MRHIRGDKGTDKCVSGSLGQEQAVQVPSSSFFFGLNLNKPLATHQHTHFLHITAVRPAHSLGATAAGLGERLTVLQLLFAAGQHSAGQHPCGGESLQRQHALALLSESSRSNPGGVSKWMLTALAFKVRQLGLRT